MAKKDLIDSGKNKGYSYRSAHSGRFVAAKEARSHPATTIKETEKGLAKTPPSAAKEGKKASGFNSRDSSTGQYLGVRRSYSMPNGDKIVTVRRDIVDRALSPKK